jgi:(1->4)-alpha-D-glucan 1-alpha-D-glucosylmutase
MHHKPAATYRLQMRPEFGFRAATEILPYLSDLGISHVYTSPYLQAARGSTHGYDVVDPTRINAELGGEKGHELFCRAMKKYSLSHIVDLVPNHMAILGPQNPWWWDVLENGPSSQYAVFFDVDWESSEDRWPDKVLLPVLGDHYGRILEAGELSLVFENNCFTIHYHEHSFPVDISSLGGLLGSAARSCGSDVLGFIADSCERMPRPTATSRKAIRRRHRDKTVIVKLLFTLQKEEKIQKAISAEVKKVNQDHEALDALIDRQNYRLALWRTAGRDLGYRRFFDINELAGLRVEDKEVFMATHALPLKWFKEKKVQGFRIDHPDGLRDPAAYFRRLRKHCPGAWILVEKILEQGEEIPADWPVQGTTGYDFLNLAGGLFIDPQGEKPLTGFYSSFIKAETDYVHLVNQCKHQVIVDSLGSDLNRLTALFVSVCEKHRRHRDYTRDELHNVLLHAAVAFPVYRSYVRTEQDRKTEAGQITVVSDTDRRFIRQATAGAGEMNPDIDRELLSFLEKILLLEIPGELEQELAMRFQQFTGPAMAKGVEDTAFYRFNRLLCLNEVGGDPGTFGVTPDDFHKQGAKAQEKYPLSMLAGTTHDTKRGEDVRARLALISEIPGKWVRTVKNWFKTNKKYWRKNSPDPDMEYFIYQTLAGTWPINHERLHIYLEKAMREAKVHTSWTSPDQQYEQGVQDFGKSLLEDKDFCAEMDSFLTPLIPAGRINSLSQTLLRLTFPGVPDIYQGGELWDMSLVDPDNRRPVDFDLRQRLLAELPGLSIQEIMDRMEEGLPKLWLIRQALELRSRLPDVFGARSSYHPLQATGKKSGHVIAFMRGKEVVSVVPRLLLSLNNNWQKTALDLPPGSWRNVLTKEMTIKGTVSISRLLSGFPVALLVRSGQGSGSAVKDKKL